MNKQECKVCKRTKEADVQHQGYKVYVQCENCGRFSMDDDTYRDMTEPSYKLASYIRNEFKNKGGQNVVHLDKKAIEKAQSNTMSIQEKYDLMLKSIYKGKKYQKIELYGNLKLMTSIWVEDENELELLIDEAVDNKHLKSIDDKGNYRITFKGVAYIEEHNKKS